MDRRRTAGHQSLDLIGLSYGAIRHLCRHGDLASGFYASGLRLCDCAGPWSVDLLGFSIFHRPAFPSRLGSSRPLLCTALHEPAFGEQLPGNHVRFPEKHTLDSAPHRDGLRTGLRADLFPLGRLGLPPAQFDARIVGRRSFYILLQVRCGKMVAQPAFAANTAFAPDPGVLHFARLGWARWWHGAFAANGTFWACIAPESYQGTTSVVPTIMAGIEGFSPCCLFLPKSSRRARIRIVSGTGFSLLT